MHFVTFYDVWHSDDGEWMNMCKIMYEDVIIKYDHCTGLYSNQLFIVSMIVPPFKSKQQ